MKVKVEKLSIPNTTKRIANSNMTGYLELSDEYLVYGLTMRELVNYVEIYNGRHLISVPIDLFVITDDRASKYWKVKRYDDGSITLWPEEFYKEYFHDDLSEDIPEVVEAFKKTKNEIDSEF